MKQILMILCGCVLLPLFAANKGYEVITDRKTKSWVEQKVRSNPKKYLQQSYQCEKKSKLVFQTIGLMTFDCVIDGNRGITKEIKQYDYQVKCENGPRNEYSANYDGQGSGSFLVDPKGRIGFRNEELCRP